MYISGIKMNAFDMKNSNLNYLFVIAFIKKITLWKNEICFQKINIICEKIMNILFNNNCDEKLHLEISE